MIDDIATAYTFEMNLYVLICYAPHCTFAFASISSIGNDWIQDIIFIDASSEHSVQALPETYIYRTGDLEFSLVDPEL